VVSVYVCVCVCVCVVCVCVCGVCVLGISAIRYRRRIFDINTYFLVSYHFYYVQRKIRDQKF
jgi:hypothetical protein